MTAATPPRGDRVTVGVLDIETAPDPDASYLLGGRVTAKTPAGVHMITATAMLTATETRGGEWTDFSLTSVDGRASGEVRLLERIDRFLSDLASSDGRLVTFNGIRHDLSVIQRRAARHFMFECNGIADVRSLPHHDLFKRMTRGWRDDWPSLRAACAGLGISADPNMEPVTEITRQLRKCETDVVATFVLQLYEMAIARREAEVLAKGWTALSVYLRRPSLRSSHLQQFAQNRFLDAMRRTGLAPV